METIKKSLPQEFMQKLRERAEKAKAEGRTTIPTAHTEFINRLKERAEKMKAEGKTIKTLPTHSDLIARLREKANKIEKKEE